MHHAPPFHHLFCAMLLGTLLSAPTFALAMDEIWGYLVVEDRSALKLDLPVSDLAYFSAGLSTRGSLINIPKIKEPASTVRRHLVLAEIGNASKLHFVLDPALSLRDQLIQDLVEAARPFEGVQIDFEEIVLGDGANYLQFLTLLKKRLGQKILSVAVPGRTRGVGDAFDYRAIAAIADRVLVMAYDEHWSGSDPGSIASPTWTTKVTEYAKKTIGLDKLVMGLPFYGRIWADNNPVGAYRYTSVERIRREQSVDSQRTVDGIPYYEFTKPLRFSVYFEDSLSISDKLQSYRMAGVTKVGFWRLGLEDPAVWSRINLSTAIPPPWQPVFGERVGPSASYRHQALKAR